MKEQLEAFLADLVEVCKKHNMAMTEQGEHGIALFPYQGRDTRGDFVTTRPQPLIRLNDIAPDGPGYGFDRDGYEYEAEGYL